MKFDFTKFSERREPPSSTSNSSGEALGISLDALGLSSSGTRKVVSRVYQDIFGDHQVGHIPHDALFPGSLPIISGEGIRAGTWQL